MDNTSENRIPWEIGKFKGFVLLIVIALLVAWFIPILGGMTAGFWMAAIVVGMSWFMLNEFPILLIIPILLAARFQSLPLALISYAMIVIMPNSKKNRRVWLFTSVALYTLSNNDDWHKYGQSSLRKVADFASWMGNLPINEN